MNYALKNFESCYFDSHVYFVLGFKGEDKPESSKEKITIQPGSSTCFHNQPNERYPSSPSIIYQVVDMKK